MSKARRQFQDAFPEVIAVSATVDPGATGADGVVSGDVTVTGAALGDMVLVSVGVDVTDATVTAQVTAANTVTWQVAHLGAGVNLASSTWKFVVLKPAAGIFD
jgi:hypothetical protein